MDIDDLLSPSKDTYEYGADHALMHWTRAERKAYGEAIREHFELSQRGFVDLARIMTEHKGALSHALKPFMDSENKTFSHSRPGFERLLERNANQSLTSIWGEEDGKRIAEFYLSSIRNVDLLGSLLAFGKEIPEDLSAVVAASGGIATNLAEGQTKPLVTQTLNRSGVPEVKVAGMCAVTKELAMATGAAGRRLFESELRNAVVGGSNEAILTTSTPASTVTATSDPVADLGSLLAALPNSTNYVIATTGEKCRALAMASQNGMSINGGEYIPGVHVVPVIEPDSSSPQMMGFACDRIAVANGGLTLKQASHASVELAESPTDSGELVSLWQAGLVGVMTERRFRFHAEPEAIVEVA
ncbi:hypothetical protein [Alcanivorax sediminis]|uniref:Phage major capsid protein n=1 Tax=Alcanivorax sediminis TaxID=2663008 RepID=A0A6N7LU91_9GAMM|nr:hypothetical protein [Alcanivorax sediminis]MQX53923.1 hypothetical protein [Alcanivorax sediminis]